MFHAVERRPHLVLPGFVLLALTASGAAAQAQFVELGKRHIPRHDEQVVGIALGDLDGDGDVDLARTNHDARASGQTTWVHLNADGGVFGTRTRVTGANDGAYNGRPNLADLDGDGDLDLVMGGDSAVLLKNDGAGTFTPASTLPPGRVGVLAAGDVDGDGDLDLVVGSDLPAASTMSTRLWLNDGSASFTDVTAARLPASSNELNTAIVLRDLDRDGDLDIVVNNSPFMSGFHQWVPGPKRIYLNDGSGRFTDASAGLPANPFERIGALVAGDVDRDGDDDLILAGYQVQPGLFLNGGAGSFTDGTVGRMPAGLVNVYNLALVDVDADGDLDLVLVGDRCRLFVNDGQGTFTDVTASRMPAWVDFAWMVGVADVDGDRDADLVLAWSGEARLLLNDGRGAFVDATRTPAPFDVWDRLKVMGDVDGDGDLDLVTGYSPGSRGNELFVNDGRGQFIRPTASGMPPGTEVAFSSLTLSDIDGDRDVDFVFVNATQALRLYVNDGRGSFTDVTTLRMPPTSTYGFVTGDVDGDGDTDVCHQQDGTVHGTAISLLLNDGRGFFARAPGGFLPDNTGTSALALGDVDGDGDLDLLRSVAEPSGVGRTRLYLNDGSGRFTDVTGTQMPAGEHVTRALVLGDVDGDGDLDLVLGNAGVGSRHRLYLNDGGGRFTDRTVGRLPAVEAGTNDARLVDMDNDGDLDLLVGQVGSRVSLLLNDGRGVFTDASSRLPAGAGYSPFAIGDVDGDGDQDVFLRSRGLLLNLHRQIDAPYLARPGRVYPLDIYSQPGYGVATHHALPFVAPSAARILVPPFGVLGLAPARLVMLPLITIPPQSGKGTLLLPIPNDPSLVGGSLLFQAIIVSSPDPFGVRLTNVALDPLQR